jgi:glyoxylase-like metal-dependent hydrolase (beta-lactamase superfamily II)
MDEIRPGVFHWKALHPRIRTEVGSYYVEDAATLIDPMLPPEGLEWFRGRAEPERIVLTNRHHYRQSDELRAGFGCPVLCNEHGLHEFEGGPAVEGFRFGEKLAPQITALEVGAICPEETALRIDLHEGMLSFADGLVNYGGLRFVSDRLLGDDPDEVKRGLRDSLRRLLDDDFEVLLFAHGEPVRDGGKEALREFLEAGE